MKSIKPYISYACMCIEVQWEIILEALRKWARRSFVGWLFCLWFIVLPGFVFGEIWGRLKSCTCDVWRHLRNLVRDLAYGPEREAFTRAYWEENVRQ